MQVMLDQAYSDIQLIGYYLSESAAYYPTPATNYKPYSLDIWASAATNFAAGVQCASKQFSVPAGMETLVLCANASGVSVQYITLQRFDAATSLALQELRVYRQGAMRVCHYHYFLGLEAQ